MRGSSACSLPRSTTPCGPAPSRHRPTSRSPSSSSPCSPSGACRRGWWSPSPPPAARCSGCSEGPGLLHGGIRLMRKHIGLAILALGFLLPHVGWLAREEPVAHAADDGGE